MQPRVKVHEDRVHTQQVATKEQVRDPSYPRCHPILTKPRKDFWNFWKWYRKLTGAVTYSENTIIEFNDKRINGYSFRYFGRPLFHRKIGEGKLGFSHFEDSRSAFK